jgi:hypothetical protein
MPGFFFNMLRALQILLVAYINSAFSLSYYVRSREGVCACSLEMINVIDLPTAASQADAHAR